MAEKAKKDFQRINDLVQLMIENDLVEIEIVDGESKILLKRPQPVVTQIPMASMAVSPSPAAASQPPTEVSAPQQQTSPQEEELVDIISPIVGTFYSAPSPDSKPYVGIDSRVGPDTVVCVIEAMKVMNEIKAKTTGTIVEISCKAGEAVEYGQIIFRVRPD